VREVRERENNVMRRDREVVRIVNNHSTYYVRNQRTIVVSRYTYVNNYRTRYYTQYTPWYRYGFRGGYYYQVRPYYDIHTYYWNPMFGWLYVSSWDYHYYRTWYGNDYYTYPELQRPFTYVGAFYPTEDFRDLNLEISWLPNYKHVNYRRALQSLASQIDEEIKYQTYNRGRLNRNDIIVNNYQVLPHEEGVVIEGFVSNDLHQFPFKALLDLERPDESYFFIPRSANPTTAELNELELLNQRILYLGGYVDRN
jgi:hypothetical protein